MLIVRGVVCVRLCTHTRAVGAPFASTLRPSPLISTFNPVNGAVVGTEVQCACRSGIETGACYAHWG